MTHPWWAEPTAGDIVWCYFPDDVSPRVKPRPALIMTVYDDAAPNFEVRVAYATSKRTTTLQSSEFTISTTANRAAYDMSGLSYDTKFDLKRAIDLPYTADWFAVPPAAPLGLTPRLGTLHPSLMLALQAAYRAVTK